MDNSFREDLTRLFDKAHRVVIDTNGLLGARTNSTKFKIEDGYAGEVFLFSVDTTEFFVYDVEKFVLRKTDNDKLFYVDHKETEETLLSIYVVYKDGETFE